MMGAVGMHFKVFEWTINHTTMVQKSSVSVREGNTSLEKNLTRIKLDLNK